FKIGTFGKATAGAGSNERYKAGGNLNLFSTKRKITLLLNSNNVNEQNFSSEDLLGVLSGSNSGPRGGAGRGNAGGPRGSGNRGSNTGNFDNSESFQVNQKNGITITQALGINYIDRYKSLEWSASYFLNFTDNAILADLNRSYLNPEIPKWNYLENSNGQSKNLNHRFQSKIDWKIDSSNSVTFSPRLSMQNNKSNTLLNASNIIDSVETNRLYSKNSFNQSALNIFFPVLYRHSFDKKGRTISLQSSLGYTNSEPDAYQYSLNEVLEDPMSRDSIDQFEDQWRESYTLNNNLVYTEPIGAFSQASFTYTHNLNQNTSDKKLLQLTEGVETCYCDLDTLLSNKYKSTYVAHQGGASYRYNREKLNVSIGINYQAANLQNKQAFPVVHTFKETYQDILPNASVQYRFDANKNLRLNYRSNTIIPRIEQVQNVISNANPLFISIGNPFLRQSVSHNINLRYSSVNPDRANAFFGFINFSRNFNFISNEILFLEKDSVIDQNIILRKGAQISVPVNLDEQISLRTFLNYSLPVSWIKSVLNLNVGLGVNNTPGIINEILSKTQTYNTGVGIVLSSNISEKVDFLISSNSNYSTSENNMNADYNNFYFNQTSRFKFQLQLWKGLFINSEFVHQYYTDHGSDFRSDYSFWNGAIGYKFLKNQDAEIRLTAFDLLKQNENITQLITENYYEDVVSNSLQQYFLLSVSYRIKPKPSKKNKE
ncbi:MAG: outer membrane beta-barrel family protein, partial [Bacteroidota bacterium]|nr:outer membrane beta-barrel family protein [Bacteroidota bacterium]